MGKCKKQEIKSFCDNKLIIDNSYAGNGDEWKMPVYATKFGSIKKNERVCQFRIIKKMPKIEFDIVDNLEGPNRGGFGSTGR